MFLREGGEEEIERNCSLGLALLLVALKRKREPGGIYAIPYWCEYWWKYRQYWGWLLTIIAEMISSKCL